MEVDVSKKDGGACLWMLQPIELTGIIILAVAWLQLGGLYTLHNYLEQEEIQRAGSAITSLWLPYLNSARGNALNLMT